MAGPRGSPRTEQDAAESIGPYQTSSRASNIHPRYRRSVIDLVDERNDWRAPRRDAFAAQSRWQRSGEARRGSPNSRRCPTLHIADLSCVRADLRFGNVVAKRLYFGRDPWVLGFAPSCPADSPHVDQYRSQSGRSDAASRSDIAGPRSTTFARLRRCCHFRVVVSPLERARRDRHPRLWIDRDFPGDLQRDTRQRDTRSCR